MPAPRCWRRCAIGVGLSPLGCLRWSEAARHQLKVPPGAPATEEGGLADGYGGVTAVAAPVAVDDFKAGDPKCKDF